MTDSTIDPRPLRDSSVRQAYLLLRFAFTIAPIVAGLDKFFHLLVDWDKYPRAVTNRLAGGRRHELLTVALGRLSHNFD